MPTILIIDDNPTIRAVVRGNLEQAGFEVIEAPDGRVGVGLFRARKPDLVITDIFMPEKEGLETVRELLRHDPAVRIIAMSSGDGMLGDYLESAKAFGAAATLKKPFSRAALLDTVARVLAMI